jgi:hypothetical protein
MGTPSWREAAGRPALPSGESSSRSPGIRRSSLGADYFLDRMYSSEDIKGRVIAIYGEEGIGKSVIAAKLGTSNLFITDDNGILSLQNHPELDEISIGIPFEGYDKAMEILALCESGELINPKTGTPFDNVAFDTISGMCSTEIRRSIEDGDIKTDKGVLAKNIPTQPHYLLSEQNFGPLMKEIGKVRNFSVTLLSHLRTGTKDVPGATTRADLHGASYKLMAKYCSVMAYMHELGGKRCMRVMPGQMTAAKTRLNFGAEFVLDDEFVAQINKWKSASNTNRGE